MLRVRLLRKLYLSRLVEDFTGERSDTPADTVINVDNQGAMGLAKNPTNHSKSKHIDIKYHFLRQCVARKIIVLNHVPTEFNLADAFTKAMPKIKLSKFKELMFGC